MTRAALALNLALLASLSCPAQDLTPSNLEKLKAATAYIRVELPGGVAQGTGFLFLVRGSAGYLMTCAHVVEGSESAQVIFQSGNKNETACAARVIATDPDRDLACLRIKDVKGLPSPLELGVKTTVTETTTVFVAGFPFGEGLAIGDKNPEISVNKAQVSSLRKDDNGAIALVQLAGEINPGNSGGPVVDKDLRVVGVVRSKLRGTQTNFTVPPEALQGFLKGRVKRSTLKVVSSNATSAKAEVTLELVDPLGTLKEVGIAYAWEEVIKPEPKAEADGTWKKASSVMKEQTLKINEESASGTVEVSRTASEPASMTLTFQVRFTQADGSTHWTEPAPYPVDFAGNEGGGVAANPPAGQGTPPAQGQVPGGSADAPPVKGADLNTSDDVKTLATLALNSVITGLHLTKDGQFLYALDLSEGKVYKIEAATMKIALELAVPDNTTCMCLTPDEGTIYLGIQATSPNIGYDGGTGSIEVVSAHDLKVTSTFPIKLYPCHVTANDHGLLVVNGGDQSTGTVVVEVSKKSEGDLVRMMFAGQFVHIAPDQARVYSSNRQCLVLQKDAKKGGSPYDASFNPGQQDPCYGEFGISPDGRWFISSAGSVLRLSKTQQADLKFVAKVDPFVSIAMAPGCNTFFLGTQEGFLKQCSLDSFELKKSIKVSGMCTGLALDAKKSVLYAHVVPVPPANSLYQGQTVLGVGNIVAWSLSGK